MKKEFNLSERHRKVYCKKCDDKHLIFFKKDVKEFIKRNKNIDLQLIEFLEGLKEFRINDELPFNTCDYHEIDRLIEEIKNKDKLAGEKLI